MKLKLILLLPLLGASCANQPCSNTLAREMIRPGVEPECFQIKTNDAEMASTVKQARKTVHVFIAALEHPKKSQRDFQVKKPFVHDGVVEHLWLSKITFTGGRFHGQVDNKPREMTGIKMGDRVSVNPNEITDWAFVDNGVLVGGRTIKVLYNELSTERKQDFLKQADFRITTH